MAMYGGIDTAVEVFGERADRVRQDLYYCDVGFTNKATRDLRSNIHAAAYVYVGAALEASVKGVLVAVLEELGSRAISLGALRPSLLTLAESSRLDSLQQLRGLRMWDQRVDLLSQVDAKDACVFNTAVLPLDGRTIRPRHLDTVWTVFGFPGRALPSQIHGLALMDLADTRNAVAHGDHDASVVAGQRAIDDTLKIVERTEDVVTNLWSAATQYLDRGAYLR